MHPSGSEGSSNREIVARIVQCLNTGDFEALERYIADDAVQEMPQSGERVLGRENQIAIMRNYPNSSGSLAADAPQVLGEETRYVMTPTFNLVRVEGSGDTLTVATKSRYPDGSDWYVVQIMTFRQGKVVKSVQFFAPSFPAPEWRRRWVEPMEGARGEE